MDSFYLLSGPLMRVSNREVAVLAAIRKHQVNEIGFAPYINTDVRNVH